MNSPASKPSIVEELSELPDKIVKISSGGYATAALTSGNDIYVWGRQGYLELSEPLTGSPIPLDLEGLDFLDVAVGMNHIVLLTTERKVFVVGAGRNGQLGLGPDIRELKDWKQVRLPLKEKQRVANVHAGYKNSFLIVEDIT
jgi:alpha-tubulin suppressor-like RCC1 family protein